MASVVIHGFENEEAAKEFLSWYSEQGEQQIEEWFDMRELSSPQLDAKKTYHSSGKYNSNPQKDENGNLIAYVK